VPGVGFSPIECIVLYVLYLPGSYAQLCAKQTNKNKNLRCGGINLRYTRSRQCGAANSPSPHFYRMLGTQKHSITKFKVWQPQMAKLNTPSDGSKHNGFQTTNHAALIPKHVSSQDRAMIKNTTHSSKKVYTHRPQPSCGNILNILAAALASEYHHH